MRKTSRLDSIAIGTGFIVGLALVMFFTTLAFEPKPPADDKKYSMSLTLQEWQKFMWGLDSTRNIIATTSGIPGDKAVFAYSALTEIRNLVFNQIQPQLTLQGTSGTLKDSTHEDSTGKKPGKGSGKKP